MCACVCARVSVRVRMRVCVVTQEVLQAARTKEVVLATELGEMLAS